MANIFSTAAKIVGLASSRNLFNISSSLGGSLYYPIDIMSVPDRPLIQFTCMVPLQGYTNIYFPMPEGVQMNDSMAYGGQDLNIIGFAAQKAAKVGVTADSWGAAGANLTGATGNLLSQFLPGTRSEALTTLAQAATDNAEIKAGISSVTQMTQNKNTVTTFDGVGIRNHSFSFKMIARSPEEADMIKRIQFAFRSGMYPTNVTGAENMRLHFPPKWKIRYVSLPNLKDLSHLPQPYDCYLQNLSTNFNASSKMWRNDKSPLEVDVVVAFTETKALTQGDIANMQYGFSADASNTGENITQDIVNKFNAEFKKATGIDTRNALQGSPGAGGQVGVGGINYSGNNSLNKAISYIDKAFSPIK